MYDDDRSIHGCKIYWLCVVDTFNAIISIESKYVWSEDIKESEIIIHFGERGTIFVRKHFFFVEFKCSSSFMMKNGHRRKVDDTRLWSNCKELCGYILLAIDSIKWIWSQTDLTLWFFRVQEALSLSVQMFSIWNLLILFASTKIDIYEESKLSLKVKS